MIRDSARCVLVAGAGDVGSRLARLRVAAGDEVVALRRREMPVQAGIRGLLADIASGEGFPALPRRVESLVFCAAPDAREEAAYRRLFVDGVRRLLDAVEAGRVLFVSSTAVYGEDGGEAVDEDTPARPPAFNGRVLLEAESELSAHRDGIVLRFSGLYGPGRDWMLRRARAGEAARRHWTNRLHVDDAASAISHLLELPSPQALYLGSDDAPALECEVMAWVREREGLPPLPAAQGSESGRRIGNALLRASGWSPGYPDFRSGYASMLARPGV